MVYINQDLSNKFLKPKKASSNNKEDSTNDLPSRNASPYVNLPIITLVNKIKAYYTRLGEINDKQNTKTGQNILERTQNIQEESYEKRTITQPEIKPNQKKYGKRKLTLVGKFTVAGFVLGVVVIGSIAIFHQSISDWWTIRSANPAMVKLAQQSGMSIRGEALFLRTKPQLDSDAQMELDCSSNAAANNSNGFIEQGCYNPTTNRIYIREMPSDLYDLEVATAAYEMLHPVYISIYNNSGQGTALDQTIEANYQAINDSFLNSQVAVFAKTEPGDRDLELFSLIGTDYYGISQSLQNYYTPYFNNISDTVNANNQVNQLFQNDQSQLNTLNNTINTDDNYANTAYNNATTAYNNANIAYSNSVSWADIGNQSEDDYNYNIYTQDLSISKQDINTCNQDIDDENSAINQYNQILTSYNTLVTQYNGTQPVSQIQTVQSKQT